MSPENAKQSEHHDEVPSEGAKVLPFPALRSFGPFSWWTIRMASIVVLLLLLGGAVLEIFFGPPPRDGEAAPIQASQPS